MTCVNNLLLILAMMLLSNGNISLFDNKNKSDKSSESSTEVAAVEPSTKSSTQGKRSSPKVRKIKKIKKKTKVKDNSKKMTNKTLNFDMSDVNKGIKLLDLSEEDLDRGMEIITRTKKYMNKEERNILIKLESVLDLVKGIKKLNDINILSEQEESDFFRSMDEEDKKNMMIKEILEVFPERKKQSVEKALDMKKKIDLLAELFLPEGEDGSGFTLSSLADLSNLGSASNLKLLGSLLRGLDDDDDSDEDEDIEDTEYEYEEVFEEDNDNDEDNDEYTEINNSSLNNKKNQKNKNRKNVNRRKRRSSKNQQ